MKTLITLLAIGITTLSLTAEVVVYNTAYAATVTGDANVKNYSYTGYLVLGMEGGLWELKARTVKTPLGSRKQFVVRSIANYDINYATSGVLKEAFALTVPGEDAGSLLFKGTISSATGVNTGTQYSWIPKTAKLSGFTIAGDSEDKTITEIFGGASLNSTRTIAANKAGNGLLETVIVLKALLAAKGYTYVDDFEDFIF